MRYFMTKGNGKQKKYRNIVAELLSILLLNNKAIRYNIMQFSKELGYFSQWLLILINRIISD